MAENDDTHWALREAAKFQGFTPNEASVAEFAKSLESRGWLRQSTLGPTWGLTAAGYAELDRLESAANRPADHGKETR